MIRWRPWMSWRTCTPPDGSHWLPGISSWWMADHPGQRELLELTRELASQELRRVAAAAEHDGRFPRQLFRMLGRSGLLGLPYPERLGGGGQPSEGLLQVVGEVGTPWLALARGG